MKKTIDRSLHVADLAIYQLEAFLEECKDLNLVRDAWPFYLTVLHAQDVCRVYYSHWFSEFTPAQCSRYRSIMRYDAVRPFYEYIHKYGDDKPSLKDYGDLPF